MDQLIKFLVKQIVEIGISVNLLNVFISARSLGDADVARLVVTIIEGADLQASDPTGKF